MKWSASAGNGRAGYDKIMASFYLLTVKITASLFCRRFFTRPLRKAMTRSILGA
jgi:hypothetical protein